MDEMTMLAELKPEPPDQPGRGREAGRARLTAEIRRESARHRTLRKRQIAGAAGIAVALGAAVASVVVVPELNTGTGGGVTATRPGDIVTAAFIVRREPSGYVSLTLKQLAKEIADPAALRQALRAEGIRAVVRKVPWKTETVNGKLVEYLACSYRNLDLEPKSVQNATVRHSVSPATWIIDPSAMPSGSTLFLRIGSDGLMSVLKPGSLPACVPNVPRR